MGLENHFFSLYGPKNIPLLKRIYFEIVEWQKISGKITCSAATNVIRQTRSSFYFPPDRVHLLGRLARSAVGLTCRLGGEHKYSSYFRVAFRHNDGKVT